MQGVHKPPPGELAEEEALEIISRDRYVKVVFCHKVRGGGVGALVVSATLLCFIELLSPSSTRLISGSAADGTSRAGLLGSKIKD